MAKTFHDWKIKHSERADGCPVVELTKDGFSPVISMSEPGTDPAITEDYAKLAALEEEVRVSNGSAFVAERDAQARVVRSGQIVRSQMAAEYAGKDQ